MKASEPCAVPGTADPCGEWRIRWDRGFTSWRPSLFEGMLSLRRDGDGWAGELSFDQSEADFSFDSLSVDGDRLSVVFHDRDDHAQIELLAWIRDGRLIGEMRWGSSIPWTPVAGRPVAAEEFPDDEEPGRRSAVADSVLARAATGLSA